MKKNILLFFFFAALITGCNNSSDKPDNLKAKADSLFDQVMEGHDIGMSKSVKLTNMQEAAKKALDSIGKLPAKAQQAIAPYKARLDSLVKDLSYAEFAMDKWMTEFDLDSARNDMAQRIQYLTDEKSKVGKVKEAILNSLQKADSLLKKNVQ